MRLISRLSAVGAVFAFLAPAALAQSDRYVLRLTSSELVRVTQRIDITTETTPKALKQFSYGLTLSGKHFALNDISLFETHFSLPWGLSFAAGHGFAFGFETTPGGNAGKILAYQVYFLKNVGGDGGGLRIAPMLGFSQNGDVVGVLFEIRIDATFRF